MWEQLLGLFNLNEPAQQKKIESLFNLVSPPQQQQPISPAAVPSSAMPVQQNITKPSEPSSGDNSVANHFFTYVKPAELSPGIIQANPGKYVTRSGTGYNVYKDIVGVNTYGPGVVKDQDLINRYNSNFNTKYTLKNFPPSIDLQFVDNVAMDRWRNSVNSAAKAVGKDNPALLITAEMFYQLGNTGASEFSKTLSLIRDKKYIEAAKEAGRGKRNRPSLWSRQTPARFTDWSSRLSSIQGRK